jgi:hypothetical protein
MVEKAPARGARADVFKACLTRLSIRSQEFVDYGRERNGPLIRLNSVVSLFASNS